MNKQVIIGITGWSASGKDTVGNYLVQEKGFRRFSFSDYLREELAKDGIEPTRDNLREKGNELRKKLGNDFIARHAVSLIKNESEVDWVFLSIRLRDELEYLKRHCDFRLIYINVPESIRYKRALERGRIGEEEISLKEFLFKESIERKGQNNSQEVDKVIEKADITVENSGSIQELYEKINQILKIT